MITLAPKKRSPSIQAGDLDAECALSRIELLACARHRSAGAAEEISRSRALCTRHATGDERLEDRALTDGAARAAASGGEPRAVDAETTVAVAADHAVIKV
jgi:hypothetical protein